MSIAALIRSMGEAGATPEVIAIAVEALEAAQANAAPRSRSSSADRMAKKRARDAEKASHVTECDVTCDASDAQSVTPLPLPSSPPAPPQLPTPARGEKTRVREEGPVEAAFAAWNALAEQFGLPLAKSLTADRRRSIKARLDEGGERGWREALDGVRFSGHCQGRNDREWRADIDFVCQPKSFNRLREGFYGRDAGKPKPGAPAPPPTAEDIADRWDRRVAEFAKSRHWNEVDWGPRPGRHGCKVNPTILAKHGYSQDQGEAE